MKSVTRIILLLMVATVCRSLATGAVASQSPPEAESQERNGEISGRIFLVTQGGNLKAARSAQVVLLRGSDSPAAVPHAETAAAVYENKVLQNLEASYQQLAATGDTCNLRLLIDIKSLQSTLDWAKKNGELKQIRVVQADEEGAFDFSEVQPGSYILLARGRAGANEAHWESDGDIKIKAGQKFTVKLGSPHTTCLD
jgi:hypothetical protein